MRKLKKRVLIEIIKCCSDMLLYYACGCLIPCTLPKVEDIEANLPELVIEAQDVDENVKSSETVSIVQSCNEQRYM